MRKFPATVPFAVSSSIALTACTTVVPDQCPADYAPVRHSLQDWSGPKQLAQTESSLLQECLQTKGTLTESKCSTPPFTEVFWRPDKHTSGNWMTFDATGVLVHVTTRGAPFCDETDFGSGSPGCGLPRTATVLCDTSGGT